MLPDQDSSDRLANHHRRFHHALTHLFEQKNTNAQKAKHHSVLAHIVQTAPPTLQPPYVLSLVQYLFDRFAKQDPAKQAIFQKEAGAIGYLIPRGYATYAQRVKAMQMFPAETPSAVHGLAWIFTHFIAGRSHATLSENAIAHHFFRNYKVRDDSPAAFREAIDQAVNRPETVTGFDKTVMGMVCYLLGITRKRERRYFFDLALFFFQVTPLFRHAMFTRTGLQRNSRAWQTFSARLLQYNQNSPLSLHPALVLLDRFDSRPLATDNDVRKLLRSWAQSRTFVEPNGLLQRALDGDTYVHTEKALDALRYGADPDTPLYFKKSQAEASRNPFWKSVTLHQHRVEHPLHAATRDFDVKLVKALLDFGASPCKHNAYGLEPVQVMLRVLVSRQWRPRAAQRAAEILRAFQVAGMQINEPVHVYVTRTPEQSEIDVLRPQSTRFCGAADVQLDALSDDIRQQLRAMTNNQLTLERQSR